ncbi:hypothetical protein [Granulicella tundricola]|uniref:hypothetical protein n=1 Tax=Granulicella tundricola TaxID=940615 RepID=UPI0018DE1BC8|nr:hypothetical protein [Granulicella tundricola]
MLLPMLLIGCKAGASKRTEASGQTSEPQPSGPQPSITTITLGPETIRTSVKRMGINLSGQSFYDSGQMLRNLTFRNPGFEGEIWQSILRCKSVTANSCTDENQYTQWPAGFLNGAHFEFISGPAKGESGTLLSSSAATPPLGVTLSFNALPKALAANDFILVRMDKPGHAEAGWWPNLSGGATLSTETKDLAPGTLGRQALSLNASAPLQSAAVSSYFDSFQGHSFVQLHGVYRLQFHAKPTSASHTLDVKLERLDTSRGIESLFSKSIPLVPGWHDYSFDFPTNETGFSVGTVGLTFTAHETSLLLDDVSLTPATHPANNPTAFRDEVVQTLRDLHPGVLRYMDNGTDFGSSLDNMLTPAFGRQRAGASTQSTLAEDIPIGLHEFLVLCQAIGAEPWYAMAPGTSPAESAALVEYLAGPSTTPYGAKRAALGQLKPWTEVFPTIHLELGNEEWNSRSFAGSSIADPTVYGQRAGQVFGAARTSPYFRPGNFDLILGAWSAVPWWTGQELASTSNVDSAAVAPYLFAEFNDGSSPEAIFGPMLAQPEQLDSRPDGAMALQLKAAQSAPHPVHLAVYEVNMGSMTGTASQSEIDESVPSMGGGLAVADHMLLMLRDLGVTTQAFFSLPEFQNDFTAPSGPKRTMPLWGAVVDMGGNTNLRRPQFLALQMLNQAILPNLIAAHLSGPNPTWNQPESNNDKIKLPNAHELQTFAFADGPRRSLILFNLSRTASHPVVFNGANAPSGAVEQTLLTSSRITDSNEILAKVKPVTTQNSHFNPAAPFQLPPFSMTVLTWTAPH